MDDVPAVEKRAARPLAEKERDLRQALDGFGRVLVAFSGGVDSSVLLRVAVDQLGAAAHAALAAGPSLPRRDRADAEALAAAIGVPLRIVETNEFENERYVRNDTERCYWCRSALVDVLRPLAHELEAVLVYGPVADDLDEDRPGMRAAAEGGFRAPLLEAGMTKDDVRTIARRLGLPIWDKPASACLASRVPTGERITVERLARIDEAETALRGLGFVVVRVRDHGDVARLEVGVDEMSRFVEPGTREQVVRALRGAGFGRVALDLEGYRPAGLKARLPAR
jgi:pyridinium-3,5-biscarboxylic acid mononucleotide sulfurtransferase